MSTQHRRSSDHTPTLSLQGQNEPTDLDEKDTKEESTAEQPVGPSVIPMKYSLLAFSMIVFFATGSSFAEGTLGPLKSTLRKELKISNAQYGAIASASSLVNTILPIIGGIGMDHWGATYAALISCVFILIGTAISSLAAHTANHGLLIAGRIITGFGSTVIESVQNKLYAHWFQGNHLALAFAVDIAWNRVTSIFSRASAVPMSRINGWWGWALWIPTIACAANLLLVVMYWWYERSVPKAYRPALGRDAYVKEGWAKKKFGLHTIAMLPMFFWLLCGSQVLQNGVISVYSSNLTDIQEQTRGTSTLAAGYNSSLQGVIPIVLTPLVGWFFDRYGWRMIFVSWTALLYIVVFVLIGFTTVHPLAPILLSSFALTSNALTYLASIPVLVGDDRLLGTAFGVWKAFQNTNSIILDVAAGAIQDRSSTNSYDGVLYLLIGIKVVAVFLGPLYDYLDGRWLGHSLRKSELARLAFRKQDLEEGWNLKGWRVSRKMMAVVGIQLSIMIVVAWVVSTDRFGFDEFG